jgi:hypothetical protein
MPIVERLSVVPPTTMAEAVSRRPSDEGKTSGVTDPIDILALIDREKAKFPPSRA